MKNIFILSCLSLILFSCNTSKEKSVNLSEKQIKEINDTVLRAGYRFSSYGIEYDAGIDYWVNVGKEISNNFEIANPASIWIVGVLRDGGVYLNFPVEAQDPLISYLNIDNNEEIFNRFDKNGYKIWLQVESGNASVEELIPLVLNRYKHHKCIIGFGVDVEWYNSVEEPDGDQVTDQIAQEWLDLIHTVNPNYDLFLKHWLIEKMPPTKRDDIVFIDDSQMFETMDDMIDEFTDWGNHFAPAKVGFQFGYPVDKKWWGEFKNPMKKISNEILKCVPNTQELYWVDFSLFDVFPPETNKNEE